MAHSTLNLVLRHAGALAADSDEPDGELLRRFAGGDEAAFAALVRRHAAVVWAACRHLLPNPADADDAFQVAFLALARSARLIRDDGAVGGWLHGVAVRAALRLRRDAARRRAREYRAAGAEADGSVPEGTWDALLAAVHEEVGRLPGPLRTAFVLCDLEGVRQPDAAARLGWKPGTLTGRLARARRQLLDRLTGRGLAPVVVGAVGLGVATATAAAPAELVGRVEAVVRAGGVVPSALSELVREVTPMAMNWWAKRLAAAVVVAGGLGVVLFPIARAQQPGAAPAGGGLGPGSSGGQGVIAPGGASGMGSMGPPRSGWEYKYVEQRRDVALFKKTLTDLGAAGWEYCDHLEIAPGLQPTDLLVFKRPAGGWATATGGMGGGMMPGVGSGPVVPRNGPASSSGPPTGGGAGGSGGPVRGGGAAPGMGAPGGGADPFGRPPVLGQGGGRGAAAGEDTLVLRAKNARASELATVLREVFGRDAVEFTADERTNSLIVRGDARVIERARALVAELDTVTGDATRLNPKR
ncbi:MAG: sigma-70 family RNA polymerase sigma factor [Gemmataceae bacterium]